MRKRHLLVGVVTLVVGAASYGLVHMTAASPATAGTADGQSASAGDAAAASAIIAPATVLSIEALLASTPDSVMLFMAGVALFGAAEGVRRHTS